VKTGSRRVVDTPLRDYTRRGAAISERVLSPAYWGHLEHLSARSRKPDDHSDVGLYAHGPDEDANTLWEQQTEQLFTPTPPSREVALAPQQIRRKRATTQYQRNLAFVRAVTGRSMRPSSF
jgi:hypothetical protein